MATAKPVRIGVIKPTLTSKSLNDLEALLPSDIELVAEYMGFEYRSVEEFAKSIPVYAEKVASLAAKGVDMIHPEGAPPFMLQGLAEERRLIGEWEARHSIPVFTTGTTQVAALRALGIRSFAGISPFEGVLADAFTHYFRDAGFEVLSMGRPAALDRDLSSLSPDEIHASIVTAVRSVPGKPEALYILGSAWRSLDVLDGLERDLGMPVLHPVVVRCWYILQRLGRQKRFERQGRLLEQMPPLRSV
jgi:maleate isomerase